MKEIEIPDGYEARIEGNNVILERKESEDERTRKELLNYIKYDKEHTPETTPGEHWDRWIAYLEKQKENPQNADSIPADCASNAKCENEHNKPGDFVFELRQIISRHRYADLYGECVDNEEGMAREIMALCEQQKEQKPEDKDAVEPTSKQDYSELTDFERAIHRGFLCAGVENVPVGIIKDTAQDCLAQIKPAEWSEEDSDVICEIIDHCITIPYIGGTLRLNDERKKELKTFVKSLSPSWKPSEEQIVALARATNRCIGVDDAKILVKLLEQLEKF